MTRGRLRIYLGAAPGVGKTVAMLAEGRRRKARGTHVVIALLETHGRSFTADQAEGLEVVPRRTVELRGTTLTELDVDAVIARKPQVALVDELAHTNAPGSLRAKRCEDIDILLDGGIDVISTVNIQHLESLNNVVEAITGVVQRETVPDDVVRSADQIELVDMSPESASAEHPWRRHRDPAHADGMAALDALARRTGHLVTHTELLRAACGPAYARELNYLRPATSSPNRASATGSLGRALSPICSTVKIPLRGATPQAEQCFHGNVSIGQSRAWLRVASALVPLAVAALLSLVRNNVSAAASVLVLVLVVVAAASTGDRAAGLIAALSSGVFFDLFLTQPYGMLAVSNPDDVEALVLLLAVGVAVTELALWGRRQQAGSSRRLGYLDGVLSAAEKVAARETNPGDLVKLVTTELTDLLGLDGCRYAPIAPHLRVVIQPDGKVRSGERLIDIERQGLPTEEEVLLPVRNGGRTVGGFVLTTATRVRRPTPEQLRVAVLLADQVGTVVARTTTT